MSWMDTVAQWASKKKIEERQKRINNIFNNINVEELIYLDGDDEQFSDTDKYTPSLKEESLQKLEDLTKKLNEMEEEILKEREYWRNTFDLIPDPIFIIDKEMNIKHANVKFQKLINMNLDELCSKKCYDILNPCSIECDFRTTDCQCSVHGLLSEDEFTKDSYVFTNSPLTFDEDGHPDSYIIVMFDIRRFKKSERTMIKKDKALEITSELVALTNNGYTFDDVIDIFLNKVIVMLEGNLSAVIKLVDDDFKLVKHDTVDDSYKGEGFIDCLDNEEGKAFLNLFNKEKVNDIEMDILHSSLVLNSDNFDINEFDILIRMGLFKILACPIIANKKLWGYLFVADTTHNVIDRDFWENYEIILMHTISNILGSFLKKGDSHESNSEKME